MAGRRIAGRWRSKGRGKPVTASAHKPAILVTGAAGYIGSHMLVALLERGHQVIALDNHVNSRPEVYERVARITGRTFEHFEIDVRDAPAVARLLAAHPVDACFHFAGLKSVTESMADPLRYFDCNVNGLINGSSKLRFMPGRNPCVPAWHAKMAPQTRDKQNGEQRDQQMK